jgi:hypothetical protein
VTLKDRCLPANGREDPGPYERARKISSFNDIAEQSLMESWYERPCDSTFILESHACLSSNQLSMGLEAPKIGDVLKEKTSLGPGGPGLKARRPLPAKIVFSFIRP